jgi:hypothetical protein
MGMMVKLPHADLRTRHLSAKSGATGHKPYDLAPSNVKNISFFNFFSSV